MVWNPSLPSLARCMKSVARFSMVSNRTLTSFTVSGPGFCTVTTPSMSIACCSSSRSKSCAKVTFWYTVSCRVIFRCVSSATAGAASMMKSARNKKRFFVCVVTAIFVTWVPVYIFVY